jgi:type IV pilus assembly protein PilP
MAMVETPDGKGYTLRIGTAVGPGKGRVKKITDKEVVVEEDYNDFYGVKKSKETTLELHTKEEELE